jgi:nucleotide-binding universal stress UspA family protein
VYKRAKAILTEARVPAESIETHTLVSACGENLAAEILQEARANRCDTVVVGRSLSSWLEKVWHHGVADSLICEGEGLTFWVVEEPTIKVKGRTHL